jgi:diguanylate cyclase (GGDEF)-like protein
MWKYLILHVVLFSILFFVHFFGSKKDQTTVLLSVILMAWWLAVKGMMDPIGWFYYLGFSLLVFYGSKYFKRWSFERLEVLTGEIKAESLALDEVKRSLEKQTVSTGALEKKADEIVDFYEQIREMSQSLDPYETFLIFAEALSEFYEFEEVKLAFFSGTHSDSTHPDEVYALHRKDFMGIFDRGLYLKDKQKFRGEVFPFDENIYHTVFQEKKRIHWGEAKNAFPMFIQDRIFAVLTLVGVKESDDPLLFILIDRFVSELQRVKLYETVQNLAITDGLTGIYVRHHLIERLEGEMSRSKRFNLKLSFLMIDIDFFKHINDEFGHLVGDVALKQVAETIQKNIREVDFVGRYGGEEFGVGLIETDEATALIVAERIRLSIQDCVYSAYGEKLSVSVSIGAATLSGDFNTLIELIDGADAAMYQAKRLGRNQVCVAKPQ